MKIKYYIVVSRVRSKKGLKIFIYDENNNENKATTIVFREVLQSVH